MIARTIVSVRNFVVVAISAAGRPVAAATTVGDASDTGVSTRTAVDEATEDSCGGDLSGSDRPDDRRCEEPGSKHSDGRRRGCRHERYRQHEGRRYRDGPEQRPGDESSPGSERK